MTHDIKIVLGLQFGDEGKGRTVQHLVENNPSPIVIRFGGGSQVGHTVIRNGKRHVCSGVGSGVLHDVPTYWTENTAIDPLALYREIGKLGFKPRNIYNSDTMLITPMDIHDNRNNIVYGSVGAGFGSTIGRNEDHFHLTIGDIFYPAIFREKLKLIRDEHYFDIIDDKTMHEYINVCDRLINDFTIVDSFDYISDSYKTLVFEGHQGILLDQHHGFFPYVTRSNTTSKDAIAFIKNNEIEGDIEIAYVMRAYSTRHGDGPFKGELDDIDQHIELNVNETNKLNEFQGAFRYGCHSLDYLNYAFSVDNVKDVTVSKRLVTTCLDQTHNRILLDGEIISLGDFRKKIAHNVNTYYTFRSP